MNIQKPGATDGGAQPGDVNSVGWFDPHTCPQCGGAVVVLEGGERLCAKWKSQDEGCPWVFDEGQWHELVIVDGDDPALFL